MGSVQDNYWPNTKVRKPLGFRGVPWIAGRGRRGPQRSFATYAEADDYWRDWENGRDTERAAVGEHVHRQQHREKFTDYAVAWAKSQPGSLNHRASLLSHARCLGRVWPDRHVHLISAQDCRAWWPEVTRSGLRPTQ